MRLLLLVLLLLAGGADAKIYCGSADCYEILGVEADASPSSIRRAYRKLAIQWHPDKNRDRIEEATERFRDIADAYAVLSDAPTRASYDYARAHPEEMLFNTAMYYYRMPRRTPLWIVLSALFIGLTWFHHWFWNYRHRVTMRHAREHPLVQKKMRDAVTARVMEGEGARVKKSEKKRLKQLVDEGVEQEDVRDYVELVGWQSRQPRPYVDLLPFVCARVFGRWIRKLNLLYCRRGGDYTAEERALLVMYKYNMSQEVWDSLEDDVRERLLAEQRQPDPRGGDEPASPSSPYGEDSVAKAIRKRQQRKNK